MRIKVVLLIAGQFWKNTFQSKAVYALWIVFLLLAGYAGVTGYKTYSVQNEIRAKYQLLARQSWEKNPDKHPHRMAHYGSFAFRPKHSLSMFDFGTESFTGNAVFLEAHKQNTVNFSEAGFSTGLLRFGEISMATLLQVVLPLIIFFLGFGAVATERENATLKVLFTHGARWKEIITGKTFGLLSVSMLFYLPMICITMVLVLSNNQQVPDHNLWMRFAMVSASYFIFCWIVSVIAVLVSTTTRTAKDALLKLLGIWLLFVILLPKTIQSIGNSFHPAPSKIEFEAAVESDLRKQGDSHNPDDPYYKHIKDSLLQQYNVDSVQQLPFNYSGFLMKQGERISAEIYNTHLQGLNKIYEQQNQLARLSGFADPFIAQKNISMAFAGTDFSAAINFQAQAEAYRYRLAQEMNNLQIELISNSQPGAGEKPHSISRDHWTSFPDFHYRFLKADRIFSTEMISLLALLCWVVLSILIIHLVARKAKAI